MGRFILNDALTVASRCINELRERATVSLPGHPREAIQGPGAFGQKFLAIVPDGQRNLDQRLPAILTLIGLSEDQLLAFARILVNPSLINYSAEDVLTQVLPLGEERLRDLDRGYSTFVLALEAARQTIPSLPAGSTVGLPDVPRGLSRILREVRSTMAQSVNRLMMPPLTELDLQIEWLAMNCARALIIESLRRLIAARRPKPAPATLITA